MTNPADNDALRSRLLVIADGIDDVADSVNTSLLDRYIEELRDIASSVTPPAETGGAS